MSSIVICEDNQQICRMLERGLQHDGSDVTITKTVAECQHALMQGSPDLLLTDLLLKGENTLDLIRKFRTNNHDLIIIAMTGAGTEWAEAALFNGANCALEKPFGLDTLSSLISSLVKR